MTGNTGNFKVAVEKAKLPEILKDIVNELIESHDHVTMSELFAVIVKIVPEEEVTTYTKYMKKKIVDSGQKVYTGNLFNLDVVETIILYIITVKPDVDQSRTPVYDVEKPGQPLVGSKSCSIEATKKEAFDRFEEWLMDREFCKGKDEGKGKAKDEGKGKAKDEGKEEGKDLPTCEEVASRFMFMYLDCDYFYFKNRKNRDYVRVPKVKRYFGF